MKVTVEKVDADVKLTFSDSEKSFEVIVKPDQFEAFVDAVRTAFNLPTFKIDCVFK